MSDAFRQWLAAKYGSIAALNGVWRQQFASFDDVALPELSAGSSREALPAHLDRLTFEDETSPDPAETVLDYVGDALSSADDLSPAAALYWRVRAAARELSPTGYRTAAQVAAAAGADADRERDPWRFAIRAAIMHGAPPADIADTCADAADLRPLVSRLQDGGWETDRKAIILWPRLYAHVKRLTDRMPAGDAQAAATVSFGFERPLQSEGPQLLKRLLDQAARARLSVALGDTRLGEETLARFPLIVCPTLEMLAAEDMQKLLRYVRRGGFLAIGPRIPLMNEHMRSDDTLARYFVGGLSEFTLTLMPCGEGGFFTLPGVISLETVQALMFESGLARGMTASSPYVDLAVHRTPSGKRLLFAANTTGSDVTTTLSGEPVNGLAEIESGRVWSSASQEPLRLGPHSVTAFEVT
ncbi:MAG: beta-galactosidase [Planctomycetes bacterium]|nr:beta-galactosidase [Planctomycetota bacterium]